MRHEHEDEIARRMAQEAIDRVAAHETTCGRMWALAFAVVSALGAIIGYVLWRHLEFG